MKKHIRRTPTYMFIMVAVLASWGIALLKTLVVSTYPQLSNSNMGFPDFQYNYIFAFLFQ